MVIMDSPKNENKEDLEGLYDLAIPLSMPVSVIRELVEKFELDLLRRKAKMDMTGEVMDREILVLRGDLETVKAAEKYMFEALDKKMDSWSSKDKEEKYKKYYEEQAKERIKELKENPDSRKELGSNSYAVANSIDHHPFVLSFPELQREQFDWTLLKLLVQALADPRGYQLCRGIRQKLV